MNRRPISPATREQREKVNGERGCRICARGPVDPAHVVSRAQGGCDSPECVIPLCRAHHRQFDEGDLDVLPVLWKDEQAHAVAHVGIVTAYRCATNDRIAA